MFCHTDPVDHYAIYTALVSDFYANVLPVIMAGGILAVDATDSAWRAWRAWQHYVLDTTY